MKKISILFFLAFLFLVFGFSFTQAQFDTATGVPVNLAADYPAFTTSTTIAGMISSIYTYALSIAGILAIVMIVYGGISYALQPGNAAKQSDAKDIMQSAVWGIVLLAGAYVILKAINPDLVILRNPGFTQIDELDSLDLGEIENDTGVLFGGTSIGCTSENTDIQKTAKLASDLLTLNPSLQTNPQKNLNEIKDGKLPTVCDGVCSVGGSTGKKTVCPSLLEGLITAQKSVNSGSLPKFTITSIMTGKHSTNSTHYQGRGLDIVPFAKTDQSAWNSLLTEFGKYATAALEYNDSSKATKFIKLGNDLSPALSVGSSNQHIHMNFGGAGSDSLDDTQAALNIQKLAQEYLKLNPNLLSGFSYGVPAASSTQTCSAWLASPKDNVELVAQGKYPFICDGSKINLEASPAISECGCNQGGQNGNVTIHEDVFKALTALEKGKTDGSKIPAFQVVAITGGIQIGETVSGKSVASRNYSGVAFDVIPITNSKDNFERLKTFVIQLGYDARYEVIVREKKDDFNYKFTVKFFQNYSDVPANCGFSWDGDTLGYLRNGSCFLKRLHIIAHQG